MRRYFFENLYSWFKAGLKFVLSVHYFACGWILIHYYKEKWGYRTADFSGSELGVQYVDSFYLMTTTISSVGYGDFKGFIDTEGGWSAEMIYLYFVTILGITLFSSVTNEIFSYRKPLTVRDFVTRKKIETELFLYEVSRRRKDASLSDMYFTKANEYVIETMQHSTRVSFHKNEFYKDLPPSLQDRLVNAVLERHI